jgi:hypothetical protein
LRLSAVSVLGTEYHLHTHAERVENSASVYQSAVDRGRMREEPYPRCAELCTELGMRSEAIEAGAHGRRK